MKLSVKISHDLPKFQLNADFEMTQGLTVLFGPSGSGKTTLANIIAGLTRPTHGRIVGDDRIWFDSQSGQFLPAHQRDVGYIFQDDRLFPHMSVEKNLRYSKKFGSVISQREFDHVIAVLGIGALLDRRPARLSGGEKQRVAIGRALLRQPKLIIADEPLANLDSSRKDEILSYFENIRDQFGTPMLYITHSENEMARLGDRIMFMERGEIKFYGAAGDILARPELGFGSVLRFSKSTPADDGLFVLKEGDMEIRLLREINRNTDIRSVYIAPTDIILALEPPINISALNVVKGKIESIEIQNSQAWVRLGTPAGALLAKMTTHSLDRLGLSVGMSCFSIIKSVALAPGA